MSVPTHKRAKSTVQYIECARQLNIAVAQTVANGPKKYLPTYGDRLVCAALDVYAEAVAANSIYPSKGVRAEADYLRRRAHLLEARAKAGAVAALAGIYFEVLKAARGLQEKRGDMAEGPEKIARRAKLNDRMERIGRLCDEERKLIGGVLKSDTERYRRYTDA